MPDAIQLLKADHKEVKELLKKLTETTERATTSRKDLLEKIEMEVKIHTQIEEEIFYPAFHEAAEKRDDQMMFYEATEEHHVVDMVLPELKQTDPSTRTFTAKAMVLKELIEHHADEEEKEMFPKAKKLIDKDELQRLGERMEQRKKELQSKLRSGSKSRKSPGARQEQRA
jgi:hemerythrin-like domain-containing protein